MLRWLARGTAVAGLWLVGQAVAQVSPDAPAFRLAPVDDPMLASLVRETLERHPAVLASQAGLDASTALEQAAARPVFNPELETDFANSDTSDRVIALSQTIDRAGLRGARTAVAEQERRMTGQRLAASRRDIALELLSSLADYWSARELAALGVLRVELMERFRAVAEQRRAAGDLTQVDFNVAHLAYVQARIEGGRASAALAAAEQSLRALTPWVSGGAWPRPSLEVPEVQLTDGDIQALATALPEVRVRRDQLAAAAAAVSLSERERRANPTLKIVGGEEEDESLIGLSVTVPLNVRNRFQYEVSAARATRVQAERELEDASIRARANLRAATQRYLLTRDAWREWRETGAANLSEQTELLERLWRTGELDLTDYLVQLNQTLDTQASAIELQSELWLAWFEWLAAAGQIGAWLALSVETF